MSSRSLRLIKRIIIAILLALFSSVLSLFGSIGYHLHSLEERSYDPSPGAYGIAVFHCDIVFNPLLYPIYWIKGIGQLSDNFTVIHRPALIKVSATTRLDTYLMYILLAGNMFNLAILLVLTFIIEIIGKRQIYLVLVSSIAGFAVGEIIGMMVGGALGVFPALLVLLKRPRGEVLMRIWDLIWT